MIKNSAALTVVGFILLFLGAFSLLLNMVGVDLYPLRWLYDLGTLVSIGGRLLLIIAGFALIFIGQTDWSKEEL